MPDNFYTVTELAESLNVTPRAIRFYEDKGLLTPSRAGTTRVFTHRDRARLMLILRGKRLGFSLQDIKEYLDLYDTDPTQAEQLRVLKTRVMERIGLLEEQQVALELTLKELRDIARQTDAALSSIERSKAS